MLVSYVISTLFSCASLYQQHTQEPHRNQEHGSLYHGLYVTGLKDGLQNYCAQAKIYDYIAKLLFIVIFLYVLYIFTGYN